MIGQTKCRGPYTPEELAYLEALAQLKRDGEVCDGLAHLSPTDGLRIAAEKQKALSQMRYEKAAIDLGEGPKPKLCDETE